MKNEIQLNGKSQVELLKRMYCDKCTDDEFRVFISVCERTGLRPESRQICAIKMGGKMVTMVTIDGLRLIAQRSNEYMGQDGPYWCGDDGVWRDVWVGRDDPVACKVGVMRKGFTVPLYAVAHMSEFYSDNHTWKKLRVHMLAKCAEALALRKCFPQELSGLYSEEEVGNKDQNKNGNTPNNNPVDLSFLDTIISYEDGRTFNKSGTMTWRMLAQNDDLPGGGSGRSYLHQLSSWKEQPWVSVRAKIALAEVENKKKDVEHE